MLYPQRHTRETQRSNVKPTKQMRTKKSANPHFTSMLMITVKNSEEIGTGVPYLKVSREMYSSKAVVLPSPPFIKPTSNGESSSTSPEETNPPPLFEHLVEILCPFLSDPRASHSPYPRTFPKTAPPSDSFFPEVLFKGR